MTRKHSLPMKRKQNTIEIDENNRFSIRAHTRSVYVFSPIRILLLRQIVFVIVFDIAIIHRDNCRCTSSSSLTRQSLSKMNERTIRCDCGFYLYIYTIFASFFMPSVYFARSVRCFCLFNCPKYLFTHVEAFTFYRSETQK